MEDIEGILESCIIYVFLCVRMLRHARESFNEREGWKLEFLLTCEWTWYVLVLTVMLPTLRFRASGRDSLQPIVRNGLIMQGSRLLFIFGEGGLWRQQGECSRVMVMAAGCRQFGAMITSA